MTEAGFRDFESIVPAPLRAEPQRPNTAVDPRPEPARPQDEAGGRRPLDLLAEFVAHRATRTPCTIGLLGGPGAGKSFALARLLARVGQLSGAARDETGSFLPRILTQRIEAAALEGEATTALAAALHDHLAAHAPGLGREAAHAVQDPQTVARDAAERLDAAQRRLEGERRGLDELDGRRARLAETILYETPGSQVDAYARAHRSRIESALAGFGIGGDPIRSYKDLVRALAEAGAAGGRTGLAARAFWSFKGQLKLLVTAVLLLVAGVALGLVVADRSTWLTWLRSTSDSMLPVAAWMETHVFWLAVMQNVAFAGAALAVVVNIWRGLRFLQPLFRGYSLLAGDLGSRRRDLDNAFAHQTRRVDVLGAEVEGAAKRAAEAERRAGSLDASAAPRDPAPFETTGAWSRARDYVAAADRMIEGAGGGSAALPRRVVVALDDLEAVPAARARELLDAATRLFANARNMVLIVALDPRVSGSGDERRRALDKWISVPFRVDMATSSDHVAPLIRAALGAGAPSAAAATTPPPQTSALDHPVPDAEVDLLAGLGPIAAASPRALQRFATVFRIARGLEGAEPAPLALMLALDAGGTPDEIAGLRTALSRSAEGAIDLATLGPRFQRAGTLAASSASEAAAVAGLFSLRG